MEKPNYFKVLAANEKPGAGAGRKTLIKALLVLEIVTVTFFIGLIPDLIALGRPPTSLTEIWQPVMSALLIALYAYARVRNIEIPDAEDTS